MTSDDDKLSILIREHAMRHRASDRLRADVRTQIALADAGRTTAPRRAFDGWRSLGRRLGATGWVQAFGWRAASVGFALGVAAALTFGPVWRGLERGDSPVNELVADHVRALQSGPLAQVASSDRHTVKPWFQGKIDYAPKVFDLQADGFPLVGGRIDEVRGKPVAALAYMRRLHVLNVFVWPADEAIEPQRHVRRGFNVLHWADGSMQYWIVSDVEYAELEHFVQAWRAHAAAQ